jgi:SAM-dependent methyltransferase
MNPEAYLEMADTEAHHWWFSGRRAIISHLIASMKLGPDAKILEIGSGTGGNLEMLSSFGKVSALEMDSTARSIASEKTGGRYDIRAGSCPADIPFAGDKFDLICLFDVLEHIEEDLPTLSAVRGLLKKGGRVLITVPAYRWLWSAHDEFLHHKRRYTREELRRKVMASGFNCTRVTYFNTLLFPLAAIVRLKDRLLGNSTASGTGIPPAPVNWIFSGLFGLERFILSATNLPFGVSLLCILQSDGLDHDS